jgi:hypothetical protein
MTPEEKQVIDEFEGSTAEYEKTLAENDLTHKTFTARKITVGFKPHRPLKLNAFFLDKFFNLVIHFGAFLFEEFQKLRLT